MSVKNTAEIYDYTAFCIIKKNTMKIVYHEALVLPQFKKDDAIKYNFASPKMIHVSFH